MATASDRPGGRGRRIGHRLFIGLAVTLVGVLALATILAIVQLTIGSQTLAGVIADLAVELALDSETTRVRIDDLRGNGISHLTLDGVTVEVLDGEEWRPSFHAAAIRLDYRVRELLNPPRRLRSLALYGMTIDLPGAGEEGPRLAPREPAASGEPEPGSGGAVFTLDRLVTTGAVIQRDSMRVAEVDLALGLTVGKGFVAVEVASCEVDPHEYPRFSASGPVEVRGAAVYLEALTVTSGSTRLETKGVVDGQRGARLRLELAPLEFEDLRRWTGWRLAEEAGQVRGSAEVVGSWNDLALRWDLEGRLGGDVIDRLRGEGRLAERALAVSDLELVLNRVPLAGEGRFAFREGGESWGRLRFQRVPLASFPVLRDQRWLPAGHLSGTVRIDSDAPGGRPFELRVTEGEIARFVIEPGLFRGRVLPRSVVVLDTVQVTTRGAEVHGGGVIDPETGLDLEASLDVASMEQVLGMFAPVPVEGPGIIHVAATGPLAAPALTASGQLDSVIVGGVVFEQVAVSLGPMIMGRSPLAPLEVTAAALRAGGRPLGRATVDGTWQGSALALESLRVEAGASAWETSGRLEWGDGDFGFDLDRLAGSLAGHQWRSEGAIAGRRRGQRWNVDDLELVSGVGTIAAGGSFDRATGEVDLRFAGTGIDLAAVTASFPAVDLHGRLEVDVEARGDLSDPGFAFKLRGEQIGDDRFTLEGLSIAASIEGRRLRLEKVQIEQGGVVEVRGTVELPEAATGDQGWRALASREVWETSEIDLALSSSGVDLTAWHGLSGVVDRLQGVVAFATELTGTPQAPNGRARVESALFAVDEHSFADVQTTVGLRDGWIRVEELRTTVRGSRLAVHGQTPVHFALSRASRFDTEAPIDLTVNIDAGDLSLSSYVTDRLAEASGPLTGWVRLTGSAGAPLYAGELDVGPARFRVSGREEELRDVEAHLVLADGAAHLSRFRARGGEKGRVEADGTLYFLDGRADGYEAEARFQRFPVRSTGEYLAELSGTVRVAQARGFPKPLPTLSGRVTVNRLDYLREVVSGAESADWERSWTGRMDFEFKRNAWVRNEDIELEFEGALTIEQSFSRRAVLGDLEIRRGSYELFGHRFRITRGDIRFVDPQSIDPMLDVEAETRTPEARIRATITGRASDRQVLLDSGDLDLDQAALWTMLVPTEGSDVSSLVAMTPLIRDLERRLSREVPGLSVSFETHDPETGIEGGLGARVGTYVSPDVFVSAYQGLSTGADQDIAVELQLSDVVFLTGEAVRRGIREGGSEDIDEEYNLNLNFRWEF